MVDTLLTVLGITYFVALLVSGVLNAKLIGLLRANHTALWKEMGSPGILVSYSVKTLWTVQRFLLRDEYLKLGDAEVVRVGRKAKRATVASDTLMLVLLLLLTGSLLRNA